MSKGTVYIVHCIDTEGPLFESLVETFKRIENVSGIKIQPTLDNLEKIQKMKIPMNGKEKLVADMFSPRILNYKKNWGEIDAMHREILSDDFRKKYTDSYGNGWKYNWFIMDWANYTINPRCRDQGFNNIFNHYKDLYNINGIDEKLDEFHWHAHPMSTYKEAHKCATSYLNSPHIYGSLCHRIIDCNSFPACFRPGFHTERPDANWFLEQFIPYDYSNQSIELTEEDKLQEDVTGGRFGDWRRATTSWEPYHPAIDDWQVPGNCNRYIFRCLNVGTRLRLITQDEVDKAFAYADEENDVIVSFCDHDYRDMRPDIEDVYEKIKVASEKYPSIKWCNAGALQAAVIVTNANKTKIDISYKIEKQTHGYKLFVETNIKTFGPQPFLAIKLTDGRYIMENFDFQTPRKAWTYTFDDHSIDFSTVDKIGIATNSLCGTGSLVVFNKEGVLISRNDW